MNNKKRIIIIGSGFAGLRLAQQLNNTDYEVFLFDKQNYHQFQPLMYQVASARLEPANISFPLRKVFQNSKNVSIRIAEVTQVDTDAKKIQTTIGEYSYDYLVLSMGCNTNYFGNKNIEANAFPMKSVPESITLRNRILQTFEDAIIADPKEKQFVLNFVIVGGGPTGVELAGALAEMRKNVLPKDYPDQDFSQLKVYLIEGSPNLLNAMSPASKKKSREYLEDLGVVIKTETIVSDYDGRTVSFTNGEKIEARNVIWAAGVSGVKIPGIPEESYTRGARLVVDRQNKINNLNDVYAIGDLSYMETPNYTKGHPQLAAVALAQGENLAANFKAMSKGASKLTDFEYKDKGSMATVGKRKAVVDLPKFSFQGRLAWFTWMFVHLMLILSVKNKLSIFINWMMSYFNNDSTLRVILNSTNKKVNN